MEIKGKGFSDDLILHITQLIQLSMLTGVDIVDYMRLIAVEESENGKLNLTEEAKNAHEEYINNLLKKAEEEKEVKKELESE